MAPLVHFAIIYIKTIRLRDGQGACRPIRCFLGRHFVYGVQFDTKPKKNFLKTFKNFYKLKTKNLKHFFENLDISSP